MAAPKPSGIAAAIGERKTSRRMTSRKGSAISSPRSEASIDSSWIARESVAKPDCVALTGGCTSSSRIRFSLGTVSSTAVLMSTWKSARISALRGFGRRRPTEPRSQGESVVTPASARSALTSLGPWLSIAAGGPCSRIANGAESPKCSRSSLLAFEEAVPETFSVVGSSRPSTPVPIRPSATSSSAAIARTARGCPLLELLPTTGSLASGGTGGAKLCRRLC